MIVHSLWHFSVFEEKCSCSCTSGALEMRQVNQGGPEPKTNRLLASSSLTVTGVVSKGGNAEKGHWTS